MARRSDSSLASLLLTQRLVDAGVAPLKASEYWDLVEAVGDPGRLLGLDTDEVASEARLSAELSERVALLLGAATAFAFALDEAEQAGMRVLASLDDDYPPVLRDRLGRGAPPLLYCVGDVDLLTRDHLGVVGSRDVNEAAASVAQGVGRAAVGAGWGVVSGAAKGVDRLAMTATLHADGVAVGVLADSLARTTRDAEVRRAVTDGRLCLCTPYKPTAGFSVANAMGRNKVIYALSRATLVVTSDLEKGGTWAGAVEALRQTIAPVLVWAGEGQGAGNDALIGRGGRPVQEIDSVVAVATSTEPPRPGPAQLHLGV